MVEYHILPVANPPSSGLESVDNDLSTHSNYLEDDDDEIVEIDLTKPIPNHLDTSNSFKRASETPVGWCQIAIIIYQRAIPLALTFSLNNVANFIMLYFAGHLPTSEEESSTDIFAGVSMSLLFSNISCLSIFVGMTGAVETLGSQNYGAKNYREVGIVLQRSILILSLLAIPIILSWFYVETIFLQVGVSPAICVVMKHFLRIRALTIPSELVSQSYQKYLMSIGVTSPSLIGTCALIVFVFLFNYMFVYHFHGGYQSLAWGFVLAKYLSDISIVLISLREEPVQLTLQSFHWSALTNWWEFIELGLPGCAMLCSEWWAFEILCVFASRLGSNEVAAQTIIGQLSALAFMIPLGLGVTASSFVGQYLGSKETPIAIQYAYTSFACLVIAELIICPSIYFFSPYFVGIFTNDSAVIEICIHVSHIIAIFTFADGAQGVLSGIYRGAGKQFYGAVINFLSYYCLGLPLAWHLTFHTSLGVAGLMTGIASAVISQTIIFLSILCFQQDRVFASVLSPDDGDGYDGKRKKQLHQVIELGEWSDEMDQSSHSMLPHNCEDDSEDDIESSRSV